MPIEYFSDAVAFARQARPFLLAHEAKNSLARWRSQRRRSWRCTNTGVVKVSEDVK